MTDLASLIRICPPPNPPMGIHWDRVEAALGMSLPQDYKELADRYGPGDFCDYLGVFHPHGATEFSHLTGPVPGRVRAYLRKDYDQGTHPVPCDPDLLFVIGSTDNGEYIFWITEPKTDPDAWRIAVNEARGPRWYLHDGTLTDFLVAVLSGRVRVPQFPDSILDPPLPVQPRAPGPVEARTDRLARAGRRRGDPRMGPGQRLRRTHARTDPARNPRRLGAGEPNLTPPPSPAGWLHRSRARLTSLCTVGRKAWGIAMGIGVRTGRADVRSAVCWWGSGSVTAWTV
ncbi:SMI1/KNR4 family protein [Streptomyces sudanensis]|uniref:SMI1/KNR4 family protein n=1 Tax=Streptomyces sudanensis TaxID=436397 RepID=UPI003FD711F4